VVDGDATGDRRAARSSSSGARRGVRHRFGGADARCHAARCRRSRPAPGDAVERRPQRPALRRAGAPCAAQPRHHRQPGHAGLHRPEAAVGRGARARRIPAHRARPPAEGLPALASVWGVRLRHVRCRRHAVARRRAPRLVGGDAGRHRARRARHAALGRGRRAEWPAARSARRRVGHASRRRHRRRRRGQCRRRDRHRRDPRRRRLPLARHLGCLFRRRRSLRPGTPCMPSVIACRRPGTRCR
jgi:hypothetical protein